MIKTFLITVSLLFPVIFSIDSSANRTYKDIGITSNSNRLKTIVLDAGHGGKDDGCSGKHSKEKHLALNITLALGQMIQNTFPEVRVIYTRTEDVFIPLYQRAAIANENDADLFISIHCNAMGKKLAYIRGSETFVMGISSDDSFTANRENQSILLEEDYQHRYQGFDLNSNEGHIFSSIFQNAYLDRSILLAEKIEKYVVQYSKRKSRGVRQDDFVVLRETTMPSVLIETGFLTNSKDELYLKSTRGQKNMADAIFLAFKEYKEEVEREASSVITTPIVEETVVFNTPPPAVEIPIQELPTQPIEKKIIESAAPYRATEPVPFEEEIEEVKSEPVPTALATQNAVLVEEMVKTPSLQFRIQLAASLDPIDRSIQKWQQIEVDVQQEKRLYKYLTGNFIDYDKAAQYRINLTKQGFKGAFVVAYKDGQRISLKEAKSMIDKIAQP